MHRDAVTLGSICWRNGRNPLTRVRHGSSAVLVFRIGSNRLLNGNVGYAGESPFELLDQRIIIGSDVEPRAIEGGNDDPRLRLARVESTERPPDDLIEPSCDLLESVPRHSPFERLESLELFEVFSGFAAGFNIVDFPFCVRQALPELTKKIYKIK